MELDIDQVRAIDDPAERARTAGELGARHTDIGTELYRIRREAMLQMRGRGLRNRTIAQMLGYTPQRVSQLLNSGVPIERAFLGAVGPMTVVMASKPAAEQRGTGRLVAEEDHKAYGNLARLAATMKIEITDCVIDAPGVLNLNRPNLLVMTGPRVATNMGEILAKDQNIEFAKDERGWYLIDKATGTTYRSPMDAGRNTDFAWFGRILRPDKQGTFIYAAGIHAMGEAGVVHLLCDEIADLYSEVGLKPFSSIVRCRFDPGTLDILDSQRVTPLYLTSEK